MSSFVYFLQSFLLSEREVVDGHIVCERKGRGVRRERGMPHYVRYLSVDQSEENNSDGGKWKGR
jgi:hypothetical protein